MPFTGHIIFFNEHFILVSTMARFKVSFTVNIIFFITFGFIRLLKVSAFFFFSHLGILPLKKFFCMPQTIVFSRVTAFIFDFNFAI